MVKIILHNRFGYMHNILKTFYDYFISRRSWSAVKKFGDEIKSMSYTIEVRTYS